MARKAALRTQPQPQAQTIIMSEVEMGSTEDKKLNIIDEYKELDSECDRVLNKIIKRKSKKAKKSAA